MQQNNETNTLIIHKTNGDFIIINGEGKRIVEYKHDAPLIQWIKENTNAQSAVDVNNFIMEEKNTNNLQNSFLVSKISTQSESRKKVLELMQKMQKKAEWEDLYLYSL